MEEQIIYLPGEEVLEAEKAAESRKIVLGPGLREEDGKVFACKTGPLQSEKNQFWIDSYQRRYVPVKGDPVVGAVVQRSEESYRVDIGAREPAYLSYMAFEGVTKKNRPDVNNEDIIYARVISGDPDFEPELTCINSEGKKHNMSVLSGGYVFKCSIKLVRRILKVDFPLLKALKSEMPFEIAVGMNGRIWIKAKNVGETIALGNAILATEFLSDDKVKEMCDNIGSILYC